LQTLVTACASSLLNTRDSFDAYAYYNAWAQEYALLAEVLTYNLNLDTTTEAYIANRITCFQQAATAVQSIYSLTIQAPSVMQTGNVTVADPALVEFLMNFSYETIPSDLIAGWPGSLITDAQTEATAWATLLAAVAASNAVAGQVYDAVNRQSRITQDVANTVALLTISANSNPTTTWNTLVAMPALTRTAAIYTADPTTTLSQQTSIARYVVCQALDQMNGLALKLRQFIPQQLRVYTVKNNDTLVLIAARELGNFERWPEIATINNLQPPYIGSVGQRPTAGLAVPGQQIFLPVNSSNTGNSSSNVATTVPNYETNYLGVDLYLGPLSDADMLPWTGDFNVQSGYDNLATALGRRIQTTLGSLIFHSDYGSRIPPEVGNVSDATTLSNIEAYAESAIQTDPRVNSVTGVTATSPAYGTIQVSATAIPNGNSTQTTQVNQVVGTG
jgi:phage baseplate assembly protein W